MKPKFIDYYMKIADITANLSYATRLKVGAVIVKNNQIIGTGYNGTPAGWDNNCEDVHHTYDERETFADKAAWTYNENNKQYSRLKTKPEVLHAEMNALMAVAKSTESSANASLFCTHAPCINCAKLIYQANIKEVFYKEEYRDTDGINFLQKASVKIIKYSSKNK